MVNSNNIPGSLKELEKEEISTSALCFGKVFIIEAAPFKWWISCNVCKEKFNSLEKFLDHTSNIHIKQINETLKTETQDCWTENTSISGTAGNDTNRVEELSNSENNKIDGHEDEDDDNTELTIIGIVNKDIEIQDDVDEIISNCEYNEIDIYDNEDSDNSKSTITEIANKNNINAGENKSVLNTKTKLKSIRSLPLKNSNQSFESSVDKEELPYPCPHCDKTYTRKSGLKRHINDHFGLNPLFKCEVCGACLKLKETLKHHMRIHTGEKPFKCDVCSRTFRLKSGFLSHITIHTGQKKFACSFCEKHFRSTLTLQVHERTHTGEKPFQCDKCGNKFVSKCALNNHNKKRHENLKKNASKKKVEKEKKFKCEICGFSFALKHILKNHMRVHLKVKTKDYKCRICDDSFVTFGGISYHMRKFHQCNASIKHNYIKKEPSGEQLFVAKVEKETNFVCKFCAASFGNKKYLKQHERIHSKSKDYMCNLCDETFLTYFYIAYHMQSKHQCAPMPNCNYTLKGRGSQS